MAQHRLDNGRIAAAVNTAGAELCSLVDTRGREFLWQAGAAWPRHAPVLFPIVGRLANDTLRVDGHAHRMTQHGFARDSLFTWETRAPHRARLVLVDSEATRASYPFAFRLIVDYAIDATTLAVTFTVANPGPAHLPASVGAHPAFRWPLADDVAKRAHTLTFSDPEPAPIRRLQDGLLRPDSVPTPIQGRTLALDESLFAEDAIILDQLASRSVRFAAPDGPFVEVAWDGFPQLGIWMKPGADFLCIEPWSGFASPVGFDGDFRDKPGIRLLAPGEQFQAIMRITLP
jgi:galactose mutarotase-like enzyme